MSKEKTLFCSCCKKDYPLTGYLPLGKQNTVRDEPYGYMVDCKICSSTKLIVKNKNKDYNEIITAIINNQKGKGVGQDG